MKKRKSKHRLIKRKKERKSKRRKKRLSHQRMKIRLRLLVGQQAPRKMTLRIKPSLLNKRLSKEMENLKL
jgi:hypothetical protein